MLFRSKTAIKTILPIYCQIFEFSRQKLTICSIASEDCGQNINQKRSQEVKSYAIAVKKLEDISSDFLTVCITSRASSNFIKKNKLAQQLAAEVEQLRAGGSKIELYTDN